jgi:SAM-dependent methyltransferase
MPPPLKLTKKGLMVRDYADYESYIDHQAKKLEKKLSLIQEYDVLYEKVATDRYGQIIDANGKRVVCLGARLGGEVRCFINLGAKYAIGLDLNPGENNRHVIKGDFHNTPFEDNFFDIVFTNCLDHTFDLDKFLLEVCRILKSDGIFVCEVSKAKAGEYESLQTDNLELIKSFICKHLTLLNVHVYNQKIGFVENSGEIMIFTSP